MGELICKIFKITEPISKGLALGASSHAIGTAKEQVGAIESRAGGGLQILFEQFNDGWILDTKPLP